MGLEERQEIEYQRAIGSNLKIEYQSNVADLMDSTHLCTLLPLTVLYYFALVSSKYFSRL